jgi:mannose-6-phosphate isomerase-like protein (cupin superfamily)/CDGSH-type Zn-finger protein
MSSGESADLPVVAGTKPIYCELEADRTYLWCACGLSKKQPFCDGSHRGTSIEPIAYKGRIDGEEVLFCTCKKTGNGPHCDGSHNDIPGAYALDDPNSRENRAIPERGVDAGNPMVTLADGCYVFSKDRAERDEVEGFSYCRIISPDQGAVYQSQFYGEATAPTPFISFGDRHVVLFVAEGRGEINIGGQSFLMSADSGIYIRPGEDFQFLPAVPIHVYISACPAANAPEFAPESRTTFQAAYPDRRVAVDSSKRNTMGARYFQMLVDKSVGSDVATQFIGQIPQSKAAPHRHLYEEALIILRGEGMMWTPSGKTNVAAGDVIFLPAKCKHSLESTTHAGLDVVGVIYPGNNPSINF